MTSVRAVWTVARGELRALFDHPVGYVLLVSFVAVSAFLYFNQAYALGDASLRPMLNLLPWVLLVFVPAVTMRALAEEARTGMLEVVLAQPVTELELLAGKYVGHLAFVWMALGLTLPIPLGLSLGADLHVGVVMAQYVGAALLAAGLVGVGLWASSVTPNQITALIVGVAVVFVLILAGANPLVTGLPPGLGNVLATLSVLPHFDGIARGVIDLRDVIYFLTLATLFGSFAHLALQGRRLARAGVARRRLRAGIGLVAATLVVLNLFGSRIGGRLDFTPGNAYTLSPATKRLLRGLDDLLTIKLFVSKDLPPEVALVKRDVRDLLREFRAAGGGDVRVAERDPASDEDAAAEARSLGIPTVQFNVFGEGELQVKEGYLGLAVQYRDEVETIPVVQETVDLEYRLATFVQSLTRGAPPVVGFVDAGVEDPRLSSGYGRLRDELGRQHEVRTLSLSDTAAIPDDVQAVVAVGAPAILSDTQVLRLTDYLRRGGGLLVLAGGMAVDARGFVASARPVGWNQVLADYGVTIRPDLAYDLASNEQVSFAVSMGRVFVSYPFWVRALSTRETRVNRDLESLLLPWASTLDLSRADSAAVTPLFVTSRAAGVERGQALIHPQRDFPRDSLAERVLAALVLPPDSGAAGGDGDGEAPGGPSRGRLVVVGNAEFVSDRYLGSAPEGLVFALNAVDWLAQDDALIAIRSKSRQPPPLRFESEVLRDLVKWGNVAGVPLLLIVAGSVRLWRRRQRTRLTYERRRGGA